MTDDEIGRIEALFHAALEREPAERSAFLEEACGGDAVLKEQVEALLASDANGASFFDKPAWEPLVRQGVAEASQREVLDVEPDLPFERLGDFRVIRRLGEGGMGVVYLAVQESLGREVALKVIRPEHEGSFEASKRFRREIEAICRVRHPNIVTVHASGEEKGVRYFVMELIPGEGLNKVLREAAVGKDRIPTSKILRWIQDIAQALDCAHEAGIVHRDVKPSNIRINPEGHAMLLDFGVARHVKLSTLTLTGEFRGTPHYASPEQVKARGDEIDAKTDIYSLGVTLYEAVTGRVPFDGETTEQVFHQILSEEPVPPRRLKPAISQDLNTVILKAIEKEPRRRYQTMADFVNDLERLQNNETILAKPAGLMTGMLKMARRNPAKSAAAAVALLALVSFYLYVVLWSYPRILNERKSALEAQSEAEKETAKTRMINDFLQTLMASPDPGRKGKDVRVVDILETALARIDTSFFDQPEIEASLRNTIATTYWKLGDFEPARDQFTIALDLRRRALGDDHQETISSVNNLAGVLLSQGELSEAETFFRMAMDAHSRRQGAEHRETLISMNNLGLALCRQRKYSEAESLLRRALETQNRVLPAEHEDTLNTTNNLALVLSDQGKLSEAEALNRMILGCQRRVLGADAPQTLASMNNLALVLDRQHKYSEAESIYRDVLSARRRILPENHRDTLTTMNNLGFTLLEQRKCDEAEQLITTALEARSVNLGEGHPDTLLSMNLLAGVLLSRGEFSEAESILRRCVEASRQSLGEESAITLKAMYSLVNVICRNKKYAEADEIFKQIAKISQRTLPSKNQDRMIYHIGYGKYLFFIRKRYEEAESQFLLACGDRQATSEKMCAMIQDALNYLIRVSTAWEKPEKTAEYRALLAEMKNPGEGESD